MRHAALLEAHRRLGLTISPGLFDVLDDTLAEAIIDLSEAGRRHARTDIERLDAAIRTLIDVRYDDDITRGRARKALASMLDVKDALGDPADESDPGELSADPADEAAAVAGSKKADKAAKKAASPEGDKAAAKTTAAKPAATSSGDEGGGGKAVEIKIAASDDLDRTVLLTEATGETGQTWDVLLIQPGLSKNRRQYRREVLQEAVTRGAFDGARAYAPDGPDHFGHGPYGRRRGTKEIVGWWTNVHYDEKVTLPDGKMAEGVVGTFNVSKAASWLGTMLSDAWARGKRDLVGWSIVGDGDVKIERGSDGRPVADVKAIGVVESVDPVVNPAAGGRTLRLVASKEGAVNWATLTLAEAIKGLAAGTILPDELKENRADLFSLVENFDPAKVPGIPADDSAAVVAPLVEAALGRFRVGQMLEAKLGLRPRLAETIKARIREQVERLSADKVLSEAEIDATIKAEVDYAAAFAPAIGQSVSGGAAITSVKDERDKMVESVYLALGGKVEGQRADPNFSIAKFYVDATGDSNFSGKYAEGGRLTETFAESVVSSTFDQVMGDSITRRMLDLYRLPGRDSWRRIASVGSVKDFRTYRRARMGGYGNLPTVAQGAPYTALTTPTDEEATYAVSKKGGTEDLTLEAIANDDLNALRQIPQRLARAASQTLFEFVWDFVKDNPTVYDSVALYHASHGGNLGTTALAAAALAAARLVMAKQAERDNAKRIGIRPRVLAVPVDLEQIAYELTQTDREVGNANNTVNFIRTMNLDVISVDYWTDANNWFLVADPNEVPTIEIAFLNGREEPELFVQDSPTVGNVFTNDKITYKIRHIYGGAVMDFRGFFGAIVA